MLSLLSVAQWLSSLNIRLVLHTPQTLLENIRVFLALKIKNYKALSIVFNYFFFILFYVCYVNVNELDVMLVTFIKEL